MIKWICVIAGLIIGRTMWPHYRLYRNCDEMQLFSYFAKSKDQHLVPAQAQNNDLY